MADTKKERRSFLKHKPSEWKREKEKVLKYIKKNWNTCHYMRERPLYI